MEVGKQNVSQLQTRSGRSAKEAMKFIIPSLIGVLLFLVPVTYEGNMTIGVGIFASYFQGM